MFCYFIFTAVLLVYLFTTKLHGYYQRWASKVHKLQILEFLGSFRYWKSVNFLCVPVCKSQFRKKFLGLIRKSQIRIFLQNAAQLCLKPVLKVPFKTILLFVLESELMFHICKKKYVFADFPKDKSGSQKRLDPQRDVPHLRKVSIQCEFQHVNYCI